jgi:SAM-dependent methyltransferase
LRRCRRCGFTQALLPSDFDASRFYNSSYDHAGLVAEAVAPKPAYTARRRYWLSLLGPPGRLIDIGCGPGALLDVARDLGWRPEGHDISAQTVAVAQAHGHTVHVGALDDLDAEGAFAAATMIEVVEHLPDPRPTLRAAARLLNPGGVLLLTTADAGSLRARAKRKRWGYIQPPTHVSYFTRRSMNTVLRQCGFVQVAFAPTYNLAHPTLPLVNVPPFVARQVRLVTRSEMLALATAR